MSIDTRGIPRGHPRVAVRGAPRWRVGLDRGDGTTVRLVVSGPNGPCGDLLGQGRRGPRLPASMGVDCARASSASMVVGHAEWTRRLEAIWEGLVDSGSSTGRWDYRAIEAKLHRRWQSHRWFEEWARIVRPNTRRESRGYALPWQWIHCGYGHIDTSPAWDGQRPKAAQRAYYRPFAASLTDEQQFELGYALTKEA